MLEKIIARDPGFISAVYRLASQYQRTKQRDKASALFARFKQLKEAELTGGTFAVLKVYGTVGKYYLALGADNLPLSPVKTAPSVRILFSPEIRPIDAEASEWKYPGGSVTLPGLAAGDVDGDGDIDLCIAGLNPDGSTSLWLNDGAGGFLRDATLAQRGISPCFGDVDNDGNLDLWLGCAGPDLYFENDGKGNFAKNEAISVGGGQLITACARLLESV
ncbi:MAG: VCBS repeat-containing protein [Planctomycetes bacterium]|nr:VCBS repeat-containing protein [Planctomycetota bacterium]